MEANPWFFRDLAYVFLGAVFGGMVAWRLRQPIILGYVLAGVLIGPFTPGPTVTHIHTLELFAEVGVILLMFSVGLEFSLKELLRVKWVALIGGPMGILLSMGAGVLIGRWMGWPTVQGVVIGSVISVASTMVLTRLLIDRGELNTEHGRVMVAITLVEDLAVVILIVLMPSFGSMDSERLLVLGKALGKAVLILVPAFLIAAKIVPPILRVVARTRNRELFFGVVLAICLGTAGLTQAVGLSPALGAFVAGLMISESAYAQEALAHLFPLRDSFVSLFFVTMGLLVDPKALISNLPLLGVMIGLILVGKFVIWGAVVKTFRYSIWTAIIVGIGLTQIGEFSFILVQVAKTSGLVGADVYNATMAASLVTILVNAALVRYVPGWISQARLQRRAATQASLVPQDLRQHVILCGYGRVGSEVGTALETFGVPYLVIEVDPDIVETLRGRGISCLFGDATHERILEEAGLERASLVVLTMPEGDKNHVVVQRIRHLNSGVPILTRAHSSSNQEALLEAGASEVVQPELEASATMILRALGYLKLPSEQSLAYLERFRKALGTGQVGADGTKMPLPEVFEFEVEGPPLADQSLRESHIRERFGVTVVAIRRHSGELVLNPPADTVIDSGDKIRVFGLREQIESFLPTVNLRNAAS
ncbi:MAG: cation:proton antiporter [Acidobacteria bacterium]|nr:cation:proton antiporter [Acidobacteriota bacterium]